MMFEIFAAWREILHISEWTGLSVGALAAMAFIVYLDPRLLKPALIAGGVVAIAYFSMIYGDKVGRADVQAQWDAAREAAVKAQDRRDTSIDKTLQEKYAQALQALQSQKDRADANDEKVKFLQGSGKPKPVSASCQLGTAANRVRHK